MPTLHIANKNYSSWSLRPWVLMRELGVAFDEQMHYFGSNSSYEAFRAFSPTGKVPCLHDGETVVWDSLAIAEYVHERFAPVWPAVARARAWARSVAAEMHSGFATLRTQCSMSCGIRVKLHQIDAALQQDLDRLDEIIAFGLAEWGGSFLTGERFTAADAFLCPVAFRVQSYGLSLSQPSAAYMQRLLNLPSMREWYAAGLAETARHASHDSECEQYGVVTADLRSRRK
jgi:glutathione S-transferase